MRLDFCSWGCEPVINKFDLVRISVVKYDIEITRSWSRIHPCSVCSSMVRIPAGSDAEYALVLPSERQVVQRRGNMVEVIGPPPCYLVCDACATRHMGRRIDGRAANPSGVRDALLERYGDGYAAWTSPESLPPLLDAAARYLSSREARGGMDFGTWQKLRDLQR